MSAIDNVQNVAFCNAVCQSLVGIVCQNRPKGDSIGTGTLISINDHKYILTASHVVKDCQELGFFLPQAEIRITEPAPTIDLAPERMDIVRRLAIDRQYADPQLDVALLKLADSADVLPHWTFRKLHRCNHPPVEESGFLMIGWPFARAGALGESLVGILNADFPILAKSTGVLPKFDPRIHFATTFPSADKFWPGGYSWSGERWAGRNQSGGRDR